MGKKTEHSMETRVICGYVGEWTRKWQLPVIGDYIGAPTTNKFMIYGFLLGGE